MSALAEIAERALAGVLRFVAVDRRGADAARLKMTVDAVSPVLGAGKDQRAPDRRVLQDLRQRRALLGGGDEHDALLDAIDGGRGRRHLDAHRVAQQALRQMLDLRRHGRREQEGLTRLRHARHDLLDRTNETEIQHAVGLVQHQHGDAVEPDVTLLHQVEEPPRRGDDDVEAAA